MKLKLKLPLAFGLTLAMLLLAALFAIFTLHRSMGTFGTVVPLYVAHERAALQVEIAFKTQVQEWKNTLLRGQNEEQRQKYWTAFQKEEKAVVAIATELINSLPAAVNVVVA